VDLGIAFGIPVFVLILRKLPSVPLFLSWLDCDLDVIVQPHRFDIYEDIGCFPATYITLPAYFLYYAWVPILGIVSFVYSCM
jgi:pheromone a factor receptor